jgi:hypothetical protein
LIFTNYKDSSDITFIDINKKYFCYSNHNLIILRGETEEYAKKLFLWLMSEQGHNQLTHLVKITNDNKSVLKVEDLRKLQIDFSSIDINKFSKIKNKVNHLNKQIKVLKSLYL